MTCHAEHCVSTVLQSDRADIAAITCVNRQAVRWQLPIRITCLSAEIISQPGVQPAAETAQNVVGAWLRFATDVMSEEGPQYYCQINCGACLYVCVSIYIYVCIYIHIYIYIHTVKSA